MTWIPAKNGLHIGDKIRLTKDITTMAGTMTKGTIVTCIGESGYRGYDFQDNEGNRILECGFDGFDGFEKVTK